MTAMSETKKAALSGKYAEYPEYKDSGVEWLGDIPAHWLQSKLGQLAFMQEGPGLRHWQFTDSGTRVICVTNITENGIDFSRLEKFISIKEYQLSYTHFTVNQGDILLSSSGNSWGKVAVYDSVEKVILNTSTIRINQLKHNPLELHYIKYYLNSYPCREQLGIAMTGSCQPNFGPTHLKEIKSPIPPKHEQTQIAAFLDHETAKIDTLIEKQQQLIELLKEKRQAVISHAVTKGLNPDAPMKDSGVEWLGEVPEHWDVSTLKYYVDTVNGFGFSSSDICEQGVPFIRAGNIKNKTIITPQLFLPQKIVDKYPRVKLQPNDLVISMVGSDPKIIESAVGQIGIVPSKLEGSVPNQNVVILREDEHNLVKKYLFYVLCSSHYRNHLNVFSHKLANQSIISSSLIIDAKFSFPEINEQKEIVNHLDQILIIYEQIITKSECSIKLMQERRTALISAAVTGKIDVRDWVAPTTSSDTNEAQQEVTA